MRRFSVAPEASQDSVGSNLPSFAQRGQVSGIKFSPGFVVATPGVLEAFRASGNDPLAYLVRHIAGDWGDVDEHDRNENELSLQHGWRLLSAYTLSNGTKTWIITEATQRIHYDLVAIRILIFSR
jgi:hypothetical protein